MGDVTPGHRRQTEALVRGFHRHEGGQSLVELALTLPLLVFALLGGADLARSYALQIAVENGARAGAESYAIDSTPTNAEAQAAAIAEIRSEERRVGKECRCRWAAETEKKKVQ